MFNKGGINQAEKKIPKKIQKLDQNVCAQHKSQIITSTRHRH